MAGRKTASHASSLKLVPKASTNFVTGFLQQVGIAISVVRYPLVLVKKDPPSPFGLGSGELSSRHWPRLCEGSISS